MKKFINPTKIVLPLDKIPVLDWNTADQDKMAQIKDSWEQVSLHSPLKKSVKYHQSIRLTSN